MESNPAARDFVADTFAYFKFIGFTSESAGLLDKAGVSGPDDGFVPLSNARATAELIQKGRGLRFWEREKMFT